MGNNNWKITCLHYGTLSCYKSLFDGGLDQVRYPFVWYKISIAPEAQMKARMLCLFLL